jgi:hypothetical protein
MRHQRLAVATLGRVHDEHSRDEVFRRVADRVPIRPEELVLALLDLLVPAARYELIISRSAGCARGVRRCRFESRFRCTVWRRCRRKRAGSRTAICTR